jgi:hypothetical protein
MEACAKGGAVNRGSESIFEQLHCALGILTGQATVDLDGQSVWVSHG